MGGSKSVAGSVLLTALSVVSIPVVCFAQSTSPAALTDGAAQVIQLTGQVSVLRDTAPWALTIGSQVQAGKIILTGADGFAVFRVSDGSTFEVYPNSRVTFRANPGSWKDLLDVWLGRVKVHIEHFGNQPNHNRVKAPTAVISVRGTTFDVIVEDDNATLVSVDEGIVEVRHALLPSKEPKVLTQGESIRVYRDQPLAKAGPNRDAVVRGILRAGTEAFYRIIYRTPSSGGGQLPTGGGQPLPGDTDSSKNPPPPPAPPPPPPPAQD